MNNHAYFLKLGLNTNPIIATRLLNHYIVSQYPSSLSHAHQLFDEVPHKDTILWTSLISAYTRFGYPHKALHLFSNMTHKPNHYSYATAARACGSLAENGINLGMKLHSQVIKLGMLSSHVVVETAFLDMYAKCGSVDRSRRVFDEMFERNVVSWNAMIAGYVCNEMEVDGLELFYRMKCKEFYAPDEFSVATVLAGCGNVRDLRLGMQVHCYLIVSGFELGCLNSLCNMYFQCGEVSCAERVFEGREVDMLGKLIKIRGYVSNHRYYDAIKCAAFENRVAEVLELDYTIIVPVLTACAKLSLLRVGRQIHGLLIAWSGYRDVLCMWEEDKAIIGSALVDMYSKCGSVGDAHRAFEYFQLAKHVSCWNSLITGYMFNGLVEEARAYFDLMVERNVISWTCMISGYVQNDLPHEALNLLAKMYANEDRAAMEGNCLTFVAGLEACSRLAYILGGRQIHGKILRRLLNADISNTVVGTALVDMYAKAGKLDCAQTSFDLMLDKNVVAWTSIIMGYALNGIGSHALRMFQQMMDLVIEPNEVTFVSVLTACSHCGLVDEGLQFFKAMKEKHKLVAEEDHYTCLIDMLGRVGRLEEAMNLLIEIDKMELTNESCTGTGSMWATLLGACMSYGHVEMGRRVAQKMLDKKQQVSTAYVALSNIYAAAGMWKEVYRVRECWRREGYGSGESGHSLISTS